MKIKPLHILLSILILALALTACSGGTNEPADNNMNNDMNNNAMDNDMDNDAAVEEPTEEVAEEPAEEVVEDVCAPATEGPLAGVDPRGVTVVWWHNHSGDNRQGFLDEYVTAFNETNECGIVVEEQNQGGYNDIRDKMNAGIQTGELPGLIVGYQNDQAFYALAGGLADINMFIDDAKWGLTAEEKADFYPSLLAQSVHPAFDNMRLGFPPNRSMEGIFYNATWLAELGYDAPPTTPDEFKAMACAAAEANGDGTGGFILRDDASAVAAWTFAFGGDVLTEDGTGYNYNGEATVAAMTFLKGMLDDGCAFFFTEGYPNPELAARHAIFTMGSSSGLPYYAGDVASFAEENGTEPDDWGFAAVPHTTDEPVQNIYGGDVMIPASTPETELASWIFVKYLTSPEVQAAWVRASGYFPTRASVADELGDYLAENPQYAQAFDMLGYGYYEPQLISYQGVRDAASQAFNEIMQGADIQATLDQLTADANALQEELAQ